jgi:hypothetical protein
MGNQGGGMWWVGNTYLTHHHVPQVVLPFGVLKLDV